VNNSLAIVNKLLALMRQRISQTFFISLNSFSSLRN